MTDYKKAPFIGKAKIISPEEIVHDTKYSFTINPNDKRQYFDCADRVNKLREFLEQQILEIPNVPIDVYMECSRNGRLHFHGTIMFTTHHSISHFYINKIHDWSNWSNMEIAPLTDPDKWQAYCVKSQKLIYEHITTKDCLDRYRKVKIDKNGVTHKSFF